ncbi:hypothetical protein HPP92_022044 [Vanilla planifolia]|uniref:FLZ-type domain-containing protein n=1 Tax=Vanilla planifolia TaxID=51239 RepID=A0A835PRH5_VANPL|nr:hypothetical protein HPP92_022044 [Vanilla planifolia]
MELAFPSVLSPPPQPPQPPTPQPQLLHLDLPPPPSTRKLSLWFDDDEEAAPVEGETEENFLDECRICGRRLGAGREAYMYGGEEAFCSEDCRLERMDMDAAVEGS